MALGLGILKTALKVITAPIRWLVLAPLRLLATLIMLALLVVGLPNAIVVLSQQGNIRSFEQAAQLASDPYSALESGSSGPYDCIVVLGASVLPDGSPSTILADRIQVGTDLYKAGVAPKIIMSGDNTSDRETYNEVVNMKRYAVEQLGIPSEDVFCDHAGLNTYDSMYRAYHVFGAHRIVVVTQTYHLYRALFDASGFRMDAIGVPADLHVYQNQKAYDMREILARVSDVLKVLTRADATHLSAPVSLDQSGDVTTW